MGAVTNGTMSGGSARGGKWMSTGNDEWGEASEDDTGDKWGWRGMATMGCGDTC